jgi:hypothetical protein
MSLSMLVLSQAAAYPEHVTVDRDDIAYIDPSALERDDDDLPARFGGPAQVGNPAGPAWPTMLFGVEVGRYDMRDRVVEQLRAAAAGGADAGTLDDYGRLFAAAFHTIFGGRGPTDDLPGFLAFLRETAAGEPDPRVRAQLERGLRDRDEALRDPLDPRFARLGAKVVRFGAETGHVPADHASVLYWLSALVPDWRGVHFAQTSTPADDPSAQDPHRLDAWWGGAHFTTRADNLGDFVDPWSCAALVNVLLRDVARSDVRIYLDAIDEGVTAVGAPRAVLRQLRDLGLIGIREDD